MQSVILFILVISAFAVFASFKLDRTFEEILPISCLGIILILYLFGMINLLLPGVVVICALAFLLYVYTVYFIVKNGAAATLKQKIFNLITPGTVVFAILSILLAYFNKDRLAMYTDEFSHWLDTVVIMNRIDAFGTAPNSTAVFPSYPPAMSLFQYLLEKLNMVFSGEFSEWKAYYAYQVLAVSVMLPFMKLKGESVSKKVAGIITWPIALVIPLYFFNEAYSSLYIDPFLGIVAGCGFAAIAISKTKDWVYQSYITLLCGVLTIAKDVGIYLSIFIALYFFIDYLARSKKGAIKETVKMLPLALCPMLSMIVTKVLWKIELAVSHTPQKFSAPFDIAGTIATIKGNGNEFYTTVYENFRAAITYRYIYYERMGFNYTAIMVLITVALLLFNVRLYRLGRIKTASCIAGTVIPSAAVIIYILSMFPLYISRFYEEEAINLASFDRYCGIVFLTGILLAFWLFRNAIYDMEKPVLMIIVSVLLMLSVYHSKQEPISYYTSRQSVATSLAYREGVNILSGKINANTDEDARILIIGTDENRVYHPILETISKPRSFTYSDVYFPDLLEEATDIPSYEEMKQIIVSDYDYVVIYEVTDVLSNEYSSLFAKESDMQNLTLYMVDKTTEKLELIQ